MSALLRRDYILLLYKSCWLGIGAQTRIFEAFGRNEGANIIATTNAYLDSMPANKAKALAEYINQYVPNDGFMICSFIPTIGIIRCIMGDQGHYYNTGINCTDCSVEFDFFTQLYPTNNDSAVFLGASTVWQRDAYALFCRRNGRIITYHGNEQQFMAFIEKNRYKFTTDYATKKGIVFNKDTNINAVVENLDLDPINQTGLKVLAINPDYSTTAGFESLKVNNNGQDYWFLPMKVNGVMEMVDVYTGNYATKQIGLSEGLFHKVNGEWVPYTPNQQQPNY